MRQETAALQDFDAAEVRNGSEADLTAPKSNFRFTPECGLRADIAPFPLCANSRDSVIAITVWISMRCRSASNLSIRFDRGVTRAARISQSIILVPPSIWNS